MQLFKMRLFYFLCLSTIGYVVFVYGFLPLGSLLHPDMTANFLSHSTVIYTHIIGSVIALALGPFQFSPSFRRKHTGIHRWFGRVYLFAGVLVGGLSGLYMSQFAHGGNVAKFGFFTLAILWLYTGARAYSAIRKGALAEHKNWMIRNFSLTFAAVTLRFYVPASMGVGIDFTAAYTVIAWLCWVPNLVIAEWKYVLKST